MADFRNYSPEDVICANLRETAARLGMIGEQERAHLRELAVELAKDSDGPREFAASLPDLLPPTLFGKDGGEDPMLETVRRVVFCKEAAERLSTGGILRPEWFLPEPDGEPSQSDRIAYQRSSYADTAYLRLSPLLSDPRATYAHSFPAACEDVFNGLCEYCILPLENSSEGQLSSFARLIDRYGLRIAATADVTATDGSRTTCFALLRRGVQPLLSADERACCLEISIRLDLPDALVGVLHAARLCGLSLLRVNTRVDPDGTDLLAHPIFSASNDRLALFLLYLATGPCRYEVIGLYPHLSDRAETNQI